MRMAPLGPPTEGGVSGAAATSGRAALAVDGTATEPERDLLRRLPHEGREVQI